jgi:hypothetical protein
VVEEELVGEVAESGHRRTEVKEVEPCGGESSRHEGRALGMNGDRKGKGRSLGLWELTGGRGGGAIS